MQIWNKCSKSLIIISVGVGVVKKLIDRFTSYNDSSTLAETLLSTIQALAKVGISIAKSY